MPTNSASSVCTWTTQPASVGQTFELFYQGDQGWWLYTGVFECRAVVKTTLPALALGLEKPVCASCLHGVRRAPSIEYDCCARTRTMLVYHALIVHHILIPTQTTAKLVDAVAERALDKNLVPPILFNNMKKMLKEGMLQVCCVELECVGFNRALYASFLSEEGGSASLLGSREPVGGSHRPTGGRKRDQSDGEPSYRQRKKRRRTDNEQH